jgi:hypothetical protein
MIAQALERVGERGEHVEVEVAVRRPVHLDVAMRSTRSTDTASAAGGDIGRNVARAAEPMSAGPPAGNRITKP